MPRFEEEQAMPHLSTAERIGRTEGRKEGRTEEALTLLLLLGRKRFGTPDDEVKAALERITSIKTLETLAERLLDVANRQDLVA